MEEINKNLKMSDVKADDKVFIHRDKKLIQKNISELMNSEYIQTTKTEAVKEVQTEGTTQVGKVTEEGTKQLGILQAETAQFAEDRQQIRTNRTDIADLRQHKADTIIETASGTMINIKDSANSYFEDFSMLGKTEQVQTTGAQLHPYFYGSKTSAGITLTPLENKIGYRLCGTIATNENETYVNLSLLNGASFLLEPGDYTICFEVTRGSFDNSIGTFRHRFITKDNKSPINGDLTHSNVTKTVTLDSNTEILFSGIQILNVKDGTEIDIDVVIYLVKQKTKPAAYEPYTGGKPSPNQNDPQEIANAGGNGQIEVQVTGKNLFDINSEKDEFITGSGYIQHVGLANNEKYGEYIKINQFESICITTNVTVPSTEGASPWCGIAFYDKDKNFIVRQSTYTKVLQTKIPENAFYAIGTYRKYADGVLQIECGTVSTAYEPYREPQIVTITLDNPLTRWDRLEKREGVWGIVRQSRIKKLSDKDSIGEYIPNNESYEAGLHCYTLRITDSALEYSTSYCTHFKNVSFAYSQSVAKNGIYSDHKEVTNKYFISDKQTIEEFKTWLAQQKEAGTPVELVYKTAEEVWEPLPEETQIALNSLHTNYPTTIISNSEDCEMKVEYIADMKNYIKKQIQAIVTKQIETDRLILERTI